MANDAEEWRRLRSEFIEAAAKYDEYETFIERTCESEDFYCNSGRYQTVGLVRWPFERCRKCWILARNTGENEEPFSVMKTLFAKAWLRLPTDIADEIVETAEIHLSEPTSPPDDRRLWWAKSNYQYWCWLLWFHWLRQHRAANPTEAEKPSKTMVMSPFHCSADLIAQWGLDGGDGRLPEWLAPTLAVSADSHPTATGSDDAEGQTWQNVQVELDQLRLRGERYTSQRKLAKKIGCKKFLVQKAIANGTADLQEWANRTRAASRLNVAPEAAAVAFDSTPQVREVDPANAIDEDDVDAAMDYLLTQAAPHDRTRINSMPPAERRQLAETAYRDPDTEEQVERHRKAKRSRRE